MVKFVRLPFYEQSDMKRLSRTNPDLSGCLPRNLGGLPRDLGGLPRDLGGLPRESGVKWLNGYMATWLNGYMPAPIFRGLNG